MPVCDIVATLWCILYCGIWAVMYISHMWKMFSWCRAVITNSVVAQLCGWRKQLHMHLFAGIYWRYLLHAYQWVFITALWKWSHLCRKCEYNCYLHWCQLKHKGNKNGCLLFLGCIACRECKDAAYCCRWSMVWLLNITMSCTKTAESIEMQFRMSTWVGQKTCIKWGPPAMLPFIQILGPFVF